MTQLELMKLQFAEVQAQTKLLQSINRELNLLRNVQIPMASTIEFDKFYVNEDGTEIISNKEDKMILELGKNAKIVVSAIKDAAGNAAKVEGDKLSWSVAGAQGLGDLVVAADGMSADFIRNGVPGICQVEVRGDADLGAGEKIIVGSVELDCLAGEAVLFELEATAVDA